MIGRKKDAVLRKRSKESIESKKQIRKRLKSNFNPFSPVEFARFFGLCIARMLCPHKRRLSTHWSLSSKGAVPAGTFSAYMTKNRFDELVQHMHFSDNADPRAKMDCVWKIRPIIDALQGTFKRGYGVGPFISFDEGMLPSQSRFNSTRMYIKDKPHKWGTKMFLTCCSTTAYCLRLEIYCGKKAHLGGPNTIDDKSGPSAVVRNIEHVLARRRSAYHVVVMDRFYTSVSLLVELLDRRVYAVGTVQTRRLGFPDDLKDKRKKRPKDIARGSSTCARSRSVPELVAVRWWDARPVFLLATGSSLEDKTTVRRSWLENENQDVPCPKVVLDYHKHMGGVDVFDQLRLQRYSVQLTFRFKKYYKSLALGLLYCALVNAYIVHKEVFKRADKKPLSHAEFLTTLHQQLLDVKASDLIDETSSNVHPPEENGVNVPTSSTSGRLQHVQTETQDFQPTADGQPRKRMARACKVCSYLAEKGTRGKNTKYLCPACSAEHIGDVYLCTMVRHESFGVPKPCFQIWHDDWLCVKRLPDGEKQLKFRRPTGKKPNPRQHQSTAVPNETRTQEEGTSAN